MIALIDNDVLIKITACDVWSEFCGVFRLSEEAIFVLPTARFKLAKNPERLPGFSPALAHQLVARAQSLKPIPDDWGRQELRQELLASESIDIGEAILFSVAATRADTVVFTGDKRSVRSLARTHLKPQLQGRICSWEQVILRIVAQDFGAVLERMVAGRECDTAIKSAFGSGISTHRDAVLTTLTSYVQELRNEALGMLVPDP